MKYKLLKDLPLATVWEEVSLKKDELHYIILDTNPIDPQVLWYILERDIPKWLKPIQEKKTFESLTEHDRVFWIGRWSWNIIEAPFIDGIPRSETFLTRQEAEDEHKRREYLTRECTITHWDIVYYWNKQENCVSSFRYSEDSSVHIIMRNSRMLFNSSQECIDSIKNFDLLRLFLTER